ncbi:MAG: tetratricopeptide repeat protein, partial [Gammaproteobacteria bacterium]|nr:tetratricopeptide repeat protein [Gammaproteobacteria bacterium]
MALRLRANGFVAVALGTVLTFANPGPLAREGGIGTDPAPFAEAVDDNCMVTHAYRAQGEELLCEGDFSGAIQNFAEAIRQLPESLIVYYGFNMTDPLRQRHARAMRAKVDALATHAPKDGATAYLMRGALGLWSGDFQGAVQDFDEAIRLNPERAAPYHLRGAAWFGAGNWQRAIRDYDEAIRRDPEDAIAHYSRGMARFWEWDHQGGIEDYGVALGLNPNNPVIFQLRGFASGVVKDHEQAIKDYGEVIRHLPEESSGYYDRAGAWLMTGNANEAIRDLDA